MAKRLNSKLIYVNSRDGYYNNEFDYVFPLNTNVTNVDKIRLASCNIPWTWYCVDFSNDLLEYIVQNSPGVHQVRLTHSNYTPQTLASELATKLKASEHNPGMTTWTVTYNTASNKFTFFRENILEDGICTFLLTSTAKAVIGFSEETHFAMGSFYTMPHGVDIFPVKEIQIRTPLISSCESKHTEGNTDNLLATISLAGFKFFDYISGEIQFPFVPSRSKEFNTITVSITNYDGYTPNFVEVTRNPFSLVFEILYVE